MRTVALLLLSVIVAVSPRGLDAQQDRASVELGVSALSLDGLRSTRSLTLVPTYGRENMGGALHLGAALAVAPEGEWSAQGIVSGTRYIAPSAFGRYEIGGLISGVAYAETRRTATSMLQARSIRGDAFDGLWAGLAGGARWRGNEMHSVVSGDVGGWRSFGLIRLTGQISVSRAYEDTVVPVDAPGGTGSVVPSGSGRFFTRSFTPLTYGTAVLTGALTYGDVDFDLALSTRAHLDGSDHRRVAAIAGATWHMDRRLALVASGGRQHADPVLGIPGGSFAAVALRLTAVGAAPARETSERTGMVVIPRRGGTHLIRLDVPDGVTRVELAGDFSSWEPVQLQRRGGGWEIVLRLTPGSHRVALRLDGGEWMAPPGLPQVADELGGVVGLLLVP